MKTTEIPLPAEGAPGGVVTTQELRLAGYSHAMIRRAVRSQRLTRIRRGWYALPGASPQVVSAVRRGGVMSCCSALRYHGVWVLGDHEHIRTSRHAAERRDRRTCCHHRRRTAPRRAVDDVETALDVAMSCLPELELLVVMESVIDKGLLSLEEVVTMASRHDRRTQRVAARINLAESGTETMVRDRLSAFIRDIRPQVQIPGVGRVDLLVDGWLIVECDSEAWHLDPVSYERDRRRDRKASIEGFRTVRLTYDAVVDTLDEVINDLRAILSHPPSPRLRRHLAELTGQAGGPTRGRDPMTRRTGPPRSQSTWSPLT